MEIGVLFDEDYLYFYEPMLTDELADADVALIWDLLELAPGTDVLDLGCGHGRIANRLAARGARVTGLDATPLFLERAREDAATRSTDVDYVEGDMRSLPWEERFDRALLWFTTFGYFGDDENRRVLAEAHRALRPGGRLAIELHNLLAFARGMLPVTMLERDGDLMIDRHRFDVLAGRNVSTRYVVRGGRVRSTEYAVRFFAFTELRDWLLDAGFSAVEGFARDGGPLTAESRRMIVVAIR
ncbi:MAG TPA: class I SAM-dependent methyltransferase [Gaiellaceae bacterium]|nr:class I SAM-dependent methyltransferase [Gaiellaceae bacterium]